MKKNIFSIAIGLAIICFAFSPRPKHEQQRNPELKKEMQKYVEQNIVPLLQKKQNAFDAKLSAEDKTFIQAKRTEAKAERKAMREEFKKQNPELLEKRKAMREEWKNMTEEERKTKKEEWKNMSDEERQTKIKEKKEFFGKPKRPHHAEKSTAHKTMRMEVKQFMMRNQDLVKATLDDLKPLYQKWTADQLEIIKKYHPEKAAHLAKKEGHLPTGLFGLAPMGHPKKMGKRGRKHRMHKGEKRENANRHEGKRHEGRKGKRGFGDRRLALEFVLWDGSTPLAETRTETPNVQNNINATDITLGQNFPNPAKSITRIQIDLPNNMAKLDLTVTDLQGKIVKQINLSELNAGSETIELNVSDLPNGQYFYSIEGKGIKTTKKMTVNH